MKVVFVLLLVAGIALGQRPSKDELLNRQFKVLQMLERIHEPTLDKDALRISESFNPSDNLDLFSEPGHIERLTQLVQSGKSRERGSFFTLFNPKHRDEVICLFNCFRSAKSWDGFYKMAAWSRERLNEGIFSYALILAVLNRPDLKGIKVPPPYEINPHYFVPSEVIHEAYRAQMTQTPKVISTKFTGTARNPQQRVAYFGEDLGLEAHHFFWHADFPFWWNNSHGLKDRKGELFFYMHHQLDARFEAERLSNNLPPIEPLGWNKIIEEGFAPHATYLREGEFPARPDNMYFQDLKWMTREQMTRFENRVREAIDRLEILQDDGTYVNINNTEGINFLGNIIESSEDSVNARYYGSLHNLCHMLLAKITDPLEKYGLPPGVMAHFETSTRDPAFFRLHKYLDNLFKRYKNNLAPYTTEELNFPGVTVEAVKVSSVGASSKPNELITFFDSFEMDLNNALDHVEGRQNIEVKASFERLNHEDFNYRITVNSDTAKQAVVRIFMTPKYHHYGEEKGINGKRWSMIELDRFVADLRPGTNNIVRSSADSSVTIPDFESFKSLKNRVEQAVNGYGDFEFNENFRHCGHPDRLLLPKGTKSGMEFTLAVVLTDASEDKVQDYAASTQFGGSLSYCGYQNQKYPDKRPMGFPFDRKINNPEDFWQSNMKQLDITITHK